MDDRLKDYNWEHIFGDDRDEKYSEGYSAPTHVRTKEQHREYHRSDVAHIIAIEDGENDGDDWLGVFEMTDGKFLVIRAGCDYTGWGCREGGSSDLADTLEDAIAFGLTVGERDRLAAQLP
jgi:hypothetical protein